MTLRQTKLHILDKHEDLSGRARTGVSLHCHTELSREMLDFVPFYAEKLPVISHFWKKERANWIARTGRDMDFSTGFWSPPMPPSMVYEAERAQIEAAGLRAMVSVSDHDCIEANKGINRTVDNSVAPLSLEWTVPFDFGFFHVGVHNLPPDRADDIAKTLLGFTFNDEERREGVLDGLFSMLNELHGVLVVLNHPLWDIELVGEERHRLLLRQFLREHGRWLHALEVNGFRSWSENKAVIEMAEAHGLPIVTGGDRHGCRPNTVVNLTDAATFGEFAEEVRVDKRSEIVLMPEYKLPLHSRQLQSFAEILGHYPEFPEGRQRWFDRVHFDIGDGLGVRKLSVHWRIGGPKWLRWAIWGLALLGSPTARPIFALARRGADKVPDSVADIRFDVPEIDLRPGEIRTGILSDQAS
jgi:hypothetical protein